VASSTEEATSGLSDYAPSTSLSLFFSGSLGQFLCSAVAYLWFYCFTSWTSPLSSRLLATIFNQKDEEQARELYILIRLLYAFASLCCQDFMLMLIEKAEWQFVFNPS